MLRILQQALIRDCSVSHEPAATLPHNQRIVANNNGENTFLGEEMVSRKCNITDGFISPYVSSSPETESEISYGLLGVV